MVHPSFFSFVLCISGARHLVYWFFSLWILLYCQPREKLIAYMICIDIWLEDIQIDFEILTLEIASVRLGGGSFGFPLPNSLFILEQRFLVHEKTSYSILSESVMKLQGFWSRDHIPNIVLQQWRYVVILTVTYWAKQSNDLTQEARSTQATDQNRAVKTLKDNQWLWCQ